MGKKGVIMDNGRTAQSSMALYWKKSRDASKHPKQKKPQQDEKEITDKSVMSNFQKWKMHKEKLISKAYTKPQKADQPTQKKPQKNDDDELMERLMESKKPKITTIPGFKSKNELANKLQIEKPKQADQSTNILRLPSHMEELTQQQIVQMLRQRKSKQNMQKRVQNHHNPQNRQQQQQDMMLGDEYINLNKKKQIQQEKQKQSIVEEVKQPQPEPSFFKSDILNKIQKEGMEKVLHVNNKVQQQGKNVQKPAEQINSVKQLQQQQQKQPIQNEIKKQISMNPKFLPRVLKK